MRLGLFLIHQRTHILRRQDWCAPDPNRPRVGLGHQRFHWHFQLGVCKIVFGIITLITGNWIGENGLRKGPCFINNWLKLSLLLLNLTKYNQSQETVQHNTREMCALLAIAWSSSRVIWCDAKIADSAIVRIETTIIVSRLSEA